MIPGRCELQEMPPEEIPVCDCAWFHDIMRGDEVPIRHDNSSFLLLHSDGGTTRFECCPGCGHTSPVKLRMRLWAAIPFDEMWRLHDLTRYCKTSENVVSVLGRPDEESEIEKQTGGWPSQPEEFVGGRHWYFLRASEHCDVHVQVSTKDRIRISYRARKTVESRDAASEDDFYEAERKRFPFKKGPPFCTCGWPERAVENLTIPVRREKSGRFCLSLGNGGSYMWRCIQCGCEIENPKEKQNWAALSVEEEERLVELTNPLQSESDVRRVLGKPDGEGQCSGSCTTAGTLDLAPETSIGGPYLEYKQLSQAATVRVLLGRYGGVKFRFMNRYIGPKN